MSLTFGLSPWVLIPALLVAAALTWWTYGRSRPVLPLPKRLLLSALRFLTLAIVLVLLFEPILRMIRELPKRPVVAFLVDTSKSVGLREKELRSALQKLNWRELDATIKVYTFDSATKPQVLEKLPQTPLRGERTDFSTALVKIREELGDDNLGGVVILSDGQYNTGRNPIFLAERFPVPIHTVVVGDSTRSRDVQIRKAITNEFAYLNTLVPVQVGVRNDGYDGQTATITLTDNGRMVGSTTVKLVAGQEVTSEVSFQPSQSGLRRLTASVTRFDGELTHENNQTTVAVQVMDNKLRVLLLGGAPSPDLSALQQVLLSDPNLEVSQLVQKAPGQYYFGGFPDNFSSYDLLILHGYPGPGTSAAEVQKVANAAREGKPLFFFLSQQTNLGLLRDGLGEVLPAKPSVVRNTHIESFFSPSAGGAVHPVLEMETPKTDLWKQLPPLLFNQSRWELAPEARILASPQINGVVLPDPLLAVRSRGKIRSATLLGAGIFRWRSLPEDLDALKEFLPNLTLNSLRWVTSRQDDKPVRVRSTRTLYGSGEAVQFSGQVFDESLNPIDRALVQLTILGPDGDEIPLTLGGLGSGRYFGDAGTLPPGSYTYRATAKLGEQTLGSDAGAFAVGALSLEFQETAANAGLMRGLAQRSNGLFSHAKDAGSFIQRLKESGKIKPTFSKQETDLEPWTLWWLLLTLVSLLSVEWFLRKRNGLL
ncbi:MAG TPA: hypothetical protein PLO56_02975 [Rhodothermales bacterium]|nr:hypothetical protein [Rhodothermales bacterium]